SAAGFASEPASGPGRGSEGFRGGGKASAVRVTRDHSSRSSGVSPLRRRAISAGRDKLPVRVVLPHASAEGPKIPLLAGNLGIALNDFSIRVAGRHDQFGHELDGDFCASRIAVKFGSGYRD